MKKDAETARLVDEMEALPTYRGWTFSYEYPGYFCYHHENIAYRVAFTPDWEGDEILPIQVTDDDGECYEDYCVTLPLPRAGRTGQKIFDLVRSTLDKLLASPASPASEAAHQPKMMTRHVRPGRPVMKLEGRHLYQVTASTDDHQTATAVVAADDEGKARTCLMLVQTTMRLRGQFVTYEVRQLDERESTP